VPNIASRLMGETVVGSAYKGAWIGVALALLLLVADPWSEVAVGGAIAACFLGGAVAVAVVHTVVQGRARQAADRMESTDRCPRTRSVSECPDRTGATGSGPAPTLTHRRSSTPTRAREQRSGSGLHRSSVDAGIARSVGTAGMP
jgi:hypothetical protein